jgi:hypothetical protein
MAIANINTADFISGDLVSQDENVIFIDSAGSGGGLDYLFISAADMWGRTTNGAASAQRELATSLVNIKTLNFDTTTQEFAQYQTVLPWSGGEISATVYWTATGGTPAQTVRWGLAFGSYTDDEALTLALGSAVTVDDTLIANDDLHISSSIELGEVPALGRLFFLQIQRNTADDNLSVDAELIGVRLVRSADNDVLLMEDDGNILTEDSENILIE